MNVLDLVIVAVVALGGWNGYRIGLIRQVTRLCGGIAAYLLAWWMRPWLQPAVASWIGHAQAPMVRPGVATWLMGDLSGALSFAAVFLLSWVILRYAAGLVDAIFHLPVLSLVNRLAGLAAGIVLAMLFVYVGVLVLEHVHNDRLQAQLADSTLVSWMESQAQRAAGLPSR
ncbi:CvpA family protein [Alicyclobacillus sp.]|uniref:CvpA family protein n=1 Tax=Alicyclobacillus sp. TaxID=61169 RepID=UPI0025B8F98F|nr:CvpA family protein [Alicyclobacillus sp.]MCL6517805.1 CvpA family protein [Alicyclobacillus sp.]